LSEDGAPYCFDTQGEVLKCSTNADRTYRAGVHELAEWARIDRPYCESDFFRELILDNASASIAECREDIRERIDKCQNGLCPQCVSQCNFEFARTASALFKCMDMQRHFGFVHYYQVTDSGQLARSLHGAVRKTGYGPVPEKLGAVRTAFIPCNNLFVFSYPFACRLVLHSTSTTLGTTTPRDTSNAIHCPVARTTDRLPFLTLHPDSTKRETQFRDRATLPRAQRRRIA